MAQVARPFSELPYGARVAMEPFGISMRYAQAGQALTRTERQPFQPFEIEDMRVDVSFDGEVIELSVMPKRPVVVHGIRVRLRHAFATDELVLMNGYQSWTDTREMPPWERMKGLRGVAQPVIDHWALDGGGDYEVVHYSGRRGQQHGFTYATFRRDEGMVLVGSLDESHGFTLIMADANIGEVILETEPPLRDLQPGERVVIGRYAITRGSQDECYDRYFELSGIKARPVKPLVGYTSWYRHYGDIDEGMLLADLAGMIRENRARETLVQHLFQIDDGYCKCGDWLEVDPVKFPRGLAPLARQIREAGNMAGLWVAPFVCEEDSRLFRERNEWLLRDEEGELVRTGPQWSGGYALDTLNVEVRSYVLEVLQTMTQEWGFELLKADFLYAACMVPHGGKNRGELMADAMSLLRTGVEDAGALILGCGVPLGSAFGVVDYCRIGCDVGLDWNDKLHMRPLHRERVSTKHSLTSTYSRAPLDGRAFGNDPDVFFLRDDVSLSQSQRDELLFADADLGSVFLTSDDMGTWTDQQRARYNEALKVFVERHARGAR